MLRHKRTIETKEQKLFNVMVLNYLTSENNEIEPFYVPDELLQYANSLNANIFFGTNFITFSPEKVFSKTDLQKLNEIKTQLSNLKAEIKNRKEEVGFINDSEIISAHKTYMDRLHCYNEAKDMAQALMGRLAQLTGTTTRELYPNFGLSFDD